MLNQSRKRPFDAPGVTGAEHIAVLQDRVHFLENQVRSLKDRNGLLESRVQTLEQKLAARPS